MSDVDPAHSPPAHGPVSGRGSALPTVDPAEVRARRREAAKEAAARRLERERRLADRLADYVGDDLIARSDFRDQLTVSVRLQRVHDALRHCRDALGFDMLIDVTAVDTLKLEEEHPERFALVYVLTNLDQEARLRVKTYVDEDEPVAPTVSDLWSAADWAEREVYDMFGLEFDGHPNLSRILMPKEYSGFPLRKDYPLRGRGERDNFPVIRRGQEDSP